MTDVIVTLRAGLRALARRPGVGPLRVPVPHPRSTKDAIESLGVPHTEVRAVLVDGVPRALGYRLLGGEAVEVHDAADRAPGPPPLQPSAPRPVRCIADVHLGTLARRLRLLGVDTRWRNDAVDADLARTSATEGRVLLTRDRGLLMRRVVVHGMLLRSQDPDHQIDEVVRRLALDPVGPRRCARCNGPLVAVAARDVEGELEPGTLAAGHEEFRRCARCRQLYWPGAHAPALRAIDDHAAAVHQRDVRRGAGRPRPTRRPSAPPGGSR